MPVLVPGQIPEVQEPRSRPALNLCYPEARLTVTLSGKVLQSPGPLCQEPLTTQSPCTQTQGRPQALSVPEELTFQEGGGSLYPVLWPSSAVLPNSAAINVWKIHLPLDSMWFSTNSSSTCVQTPWLEAPQKQTRISFHPRKYQLFLLL